MSKFLELIGIVLVVIMFVAFVGLIPNYEAGLSPLFWGCAAGALGIIMYRKWKRKKLEESK